MVIVFLSNFFFGVLASNFSLLDIDSNTNQSPNATKCVTIVASSSDEEEIVRDFMVYHGLRLVGAPATKLNKKCAKKSKMQ